MIIQLLTNTVIVAIAIAAVAWLTKQIIIHFLSKDIEIYKKKLEIESSKEIEKLKASLQITASEHSIRFSSLHTKSALVIAELYSMLIDTYDAAQKLLTMPEIGELEKEIGSKKLEARKAIDLLSKFLEFSQKNKIYLGNDVCEKIQGILIKIGELIVLFNKIYQSAQDSKFTLPGDIESLKETIRAFVKEVPKLKESLEEEFRKYLGVKNNTELINL